MSRIDDLIAQHCPDGVEFKRLGDVLRIKNGKDHKTLSDGEIPVYGSGGIMRNVDSAAAVGPSVLIPRKGSLGNIFYVEGPFWVVDTIFRTEIDLGQIEPKFVYHLLLTMKLDEMNQAGGVPSQTQSALNSLQIPVPPLPVQRAIVEVLDTFSKLEAELEAELEARRLQYEHYRDQLLTFRDATHTHTHTHTHRTNIRWAAMSEVGTLVRGRRFTKSDIVDAGIPSVHYGEIYTDYGVAATRAVREIRADIARQLRFANPNDVIFAGVGETVTDVGKAVAWVGDSPVAIHDDTFAYTSDLNPRFVAYFSQTAAFQRQKDPLVSRAKVKRLSAKGLGTISIPVPSRNEQDRVVSILDKFDAFVDDLSVGLPAE